MIEGLCRNSFQKYCVDPVAKLLAISCSPDQLTLMALILGCCVPVFLYFGYSSLAACLLIASGYCDVLDGTIARLRSETSAMGCVFDIVSDRIVEFAVVFGLFLVDPGARALWAICMLGSMLLCITSFLVVGIFSEQAGTKSFHYDVGLMERAEAFLFFILMIFLRNHFVFLSIVFIILVLLTSLERLVRFFIKEKKHECDLRRCSKTIR